MAFRPSPRIREPVAAATRRMLAVHARPIRAPAEKLMSLRGRDDFAFTLSRPLKRCCARVSIPCRIQLSREPLLRKVFVESYLNRARSFRKPRFPERSALQLCKCPLECPARLFFCHFPGAAGCRLMLLRIKYSVVAHAARMSGAVRMDAGDFLLVPRCVAAVKPRETERKTELPTTHSRRSIIFESSKLSAFSLNARRFFLPIIVRVSCTRCVL